MADLLNRKQLKAALEFEYSKNTVLKESIDLRRFNILAFNGISREGLSYGKKERRICLYETLKGEKIYIQFPGKESEEENKMPLDFRPELQMSNGSFITPTSFGDIWDILDNIGQDHKKELAYVAALLLRVGYMYGYKKNNLKYDYCDVLIDKKVILKEDKLDFEWYSLDINGDVWYTLNDIFDDMYLSANERFSFEAFIKYFDLLVQNEDCKFYYKNVIDEKKERKKEYKFENGRTKSCETSLFVLSHLERKTKLSELLNRFQNARGVAPIKKADYVCVTDGIIKNIDVR